MKNKLGQIAIIIFILNNTLFDLISMPNSTHLSVAFFSIMYFSLLLFSINDWLKTNNLFGIVMGFGFTVRILWELSKWNLPYKEYMISVNSFEKGLLFTFLLIATLLTFISHERRNNNNRNDN